MNNYLSDWLPIATGVPQGSVLGPLLFLVYINVINQAVSNSNLVLFADDTNISRELKLSSELKYLILAVPK